MTADLIIITLQTREGEKVHSVARMIDPSKEGQMRMSMGLKEQIWFEVLGLDRQLAATLAREPRAKH
jgi:hypothetical protein